MALYIDPTIAAAIARILGTTAVAPTLTAVPNQTPDINVLQPALTPVPETPIINVAQPPATPVINQAAINAYLAQALGYGQPTPQLTSVPNEIPNINVAQGTQRPQMDTRAMTDAISRAMAPTTPIAHQVGTATPRQLTPYAPTTGGTEAGSLFARAIGTLGGGAKTTQPIPNDWRMRYA